MAFLKNGAQSTTAHAVCCSYLQRSLNGNGFNFRSRNLQVCQFIFHFHSRFLPFSCLTCFYFIASDTLVFPLCSFAMNTYRSTLRKSSKLCLPNTAFPVLHCLDVLFTCFSLLYIFITLSLATVPASSNILDETCTYSSYSSYDSSRTISSPSTNGKHFVSRWNSTLTVTITAMTHTHASSYHNCTESHPSFE